MALRLAADFSQTLYSNIQGVKNWFFPNSAETEIDEEGSSLEDKLFHLDMREKDVAFITNQGQDYLDFPDALAKRLSLKVVLANEALDVLKAHKISQIPKEKIQNFEHQQKENPPESPQDSIILLKDIDKDVASPYLQPEENKPLTESDEMLIKERLKDEFSVAEIAEELNLSEKKINEYVENRFISFKGKDGKIVLEIIRRCFNRLPIAILREMIAKKDLKLQEKICFELEKNNHEEYTTVKDYFRRFEESQNFFEIDHTFSIEAKTCIRASALDNVGELSLKLNRMERLIRDYLLQYSSDLELLSSCEQEQLRQIQNLKDNFGGEMQISHTTYRMIISDSFASLIEKANKLDGSPMGIFIELLPLVFYYIKCSLPLDELTHIISNTTEISLTTLDIFHLMFQMSDPVVRGLCIEHYSFSNPVPFYYPILGPYPPEQTSCQFEICKELWYSLQQFSGLVSFGLGWASWNLIGKSHLLDLMFETDFVKGSPQNSPFHLGSIDIQMTKNIFGLKDSNESTQWAYIDCHRCSDINLIQDICQYLDIALIHVSYSDYTENYSRLMENLNKITCHTKHVYVLIRDCTNTKLSPKQIFVDTEKYHFMFIENLLNFEQNDLRSSTLREIGYKVLHSANSKPIGTDYLEKLLLRQSNWNISEKELIQSIKNDICSNVQDRNKINFSFLSYYPHFIEYMRCFYEVSSKTDQKVIDALNRKCEQLAKHLENAKMSEVVLHFNEILSQENSTLILWKLSQELSMLSKHALPDINQTAYTLEILWRETLLSNKYNLMKKIRSKQVDVYLNTFPSNFSKYVERGEPFELIDGDNLRFLNLEIDILLSDLYETQNKEVTSFNSRKRPPIVVSIFGPQSSGKSTLLNYCFGCKFLTSAGRCTKGIYASLSKLSQPIKNSEHFLILDTEGLDSSEREEMIQDSCCINFDRTMVLFCLAVSQVIIINVKGDIGEEMQNLLQICAYSLNKLKVSKVKAPKIFFVLNQQADPDPNKHLNSINTLLRKLNKESYLMEKEELKISDLIEVSRENLFVLPSAFNSESLNTQMTKLFDSDLCKLFPTIDFANRCANLRLSIIRQLKADSSDNESSFNTLSEWLEMSSVIWDTIIKYQDIVKYKNVEELRCSNKLDELVGGLMEKKETIYSNKKENQIRVNWNQKKMRDVDRTIANKFAGDFLVDVRRAVNSLCEQSIYEEYFEREADRLSHKNILLLANEKITEVLQYASKSIEDERLKEDKTHLLNRIKTQNEPLIRMPSIPNPLPKDFPYPNLPIEEDNFVVQFICNRIQTLLDLFQEEWKNLSKRLFAKIFGNMKIKFIKHISIVKDVLEEFLKMLEGMCKEKDRLLEIGTDSDSNFELAAEAATEESACNPDPKTREAPFKAMVLFLEKYLNPKVSPGEFNQFFTGIFEVDGVKMIRHRDTYVLFEKPHHPAQELDEDLFQKLSDTKMFSAETIFNIKVYLQEFLRALNCYEYQVTVDEYDNILKAIKEQFEANIINCPSKCPSCGKFCEKEIHPQEGKCQILTGHQYCSMGGDVWNNNEEKTAILLMCDDFNDDSPVLIPGQNMKWWEFKEKCGDQWDWTLPTEERYVALQKENRNRMEKIWKIFGEEILKYYAKKGTHIKYLPYTSPKRIYESLFTVKYYVCFVIDGTDRMGESIDLISKWVSDLMEDTALGGTPYFKIIVYHGHAVSEMECVEKFPNNSEFTTEGEDIQDFIDKITTYGDGTESSMLHGIATATTQSDWKSGYDVRNVIFHIYCEPSNGYFNIFTAERKCRKGCSFKWKRDIKDKIRELKIDYRRECLISYTHPDYKSISSEPISLKVSSKCTLNSGKKTKSKEDILINYQNDD